MDGAAALEQSLVELGRVVAAIPPDSWGRRTPCEYWSVDDVFAHVLTITDKFTRFASEATDSPRGRRIATDDRVAAMDRIASDSARAWPTVDPLRVCHLPFGSFTADEAAWVNAADVLIHTWDMAVGARVDFTMPDDLVPGAMRTVGRLTTLEAVRSGQFAPAVRSASGTGSAELLIASGRSPTWPDAADSRESTGA